MLSVCGRATGAADEHVIWLADTLPYSGDLDVCATIVCFSALAVRMELDLVRAPICVAWV